VASDEHDAQGIACCEIACAWTGIAWTMLLLTIKLGAYLGLADAFCNSLTFCSILCILSIVATKHTCTCQICWPEKVGTNASAGFINMPRVQRLVHWMLHGYKQPFSRQTAEAEQTTSGL
jgi:hypothetical protein